MFVSVFRIGREDVETKTGAVATGDGTSPKAALSAHDFSPMDQIAFVFLPAMNAMHPRRNGGRAKRVILWRWRPIHKNNIPHPFAI